SRWTIGLLGNLTSATTNTYFLAYPPVSKPTGEPRPKVIQRIIQTGLRPTDGCEWLSKLDPHRYGTNKASYSELPPTRQTQFPEQERKRQAEDECSNYREWEANEPNQR
ncbi:hypothetical protein, partial [Massilia sp. BKSP1R2A-1]|uniref:hypothetical protein n=1 Tax=Massilia sp. BKSP1R2A-1 TaxID=3422595 RepID=UPI003D33D39B